MTLKCEGQTVDVVRAASPGDERMGYEANKGDQVVIKTADGTEKVVLKSAVTKA